jgi:hypothetical protein
MPLTAVKMHLYTTTIYGRNVAHDDKLWFILMIVCLLKLSLTFSFNVPLRQRGIGRKSNAPPRYRKDTLFRSAQRSSQSL